MIPFKPFYFMRHGQTEWNKEHRCMGNMDIPLNRLGEQQAFDALETLKEIKIDRIMSSPLIRAYRTAEIIGTHYKLPIEIEHMLLEANWGKLQGQPKDDGASFMKWRQGITPPNAETFKEVKRRVSICLTQLLTSNKTVLIVSHGGVYWAILDLLNISYSDISNCQIAYFVPTSPTGGPGLSTIL